MPDARDTDLLREYAAHNSEPAFTDLVRRHINLVYSVALRYVGNTEDAQDVTQAVFIILAQKAARLREKTVLTGWLYETTRFTAARFLRTRARRHAREQEAYMQSTLNEAETDSVWRQLAPRLEEAMTRLTEKERTLLALRYFENRSGAETAALLGIQEWAARKRAARAVEKLRTFFARRGIGISTSILIGAISANSVQAAPVALAKTVTAVALAKGAAASGSTLTLVKGALKIMAWTKAKTAIVVSMGVLLATSATVTFWHFHFGKDSWRSRFDAVYKLKAGEVMRYIAPPFISERAEYYHTEKLLSDQAKAIPKPPDFFIFKQDTNGQLHYSMCGFGYKQHSLQQVLNQTLRFRRYEFEAPEELLKLNLTGDWTIQEGVSREAFLAGLEPILRKVSGRNIHFEKQTVERQVIVAHGSSEEGRQTTIQIYAENSKGRDNGQGMGYTQDLLGALGEQLNLYVVNETQTNLLHGDFYQWKYCLDANFSKMGNRREELTDEVLKNLTTQTGISFTREQRPVDVWLISEKP